MDDDSLKRYKPERLKSLVEAIKAELARRDTNLEAQREEVERARDGLSDMNEAHPPTYQVEEEKQVSK